MLFSIGTLVARLILDEIGCSIFAGNFLMTPSPHFILGFANVRDPPVTSDVLYGGGGGKGCGPVGGGFACLFACLRGWAIVLLLLTTLRVYSLVIGGFLVAVASPDLLGSRYRRYRRYRRRVDRCGTFRDNLTADGR